MLVVVNVGRRKSGKTFLTREYLSVLRSKGYTDFHIYDPNLEYTDFSGNSDLIPIKDFHKKGTEMRDTVIVYEEATIFFRHAADEDVLNLCVRSRHRKGGKNLGNFLIFNFHALRSVPLYILDNVDIINIKKTNDNFKNIENKFEDFPQIFDAFCRARDSESSYFTESVELYG